MGHLNFLFLILKEATLSIYPFIPYPLADNICSQFSHFERGGNVEIGKR